MSQILLFPDSHIISIIICTDPSDVNINFLGVGSNILRVFDKQCSTICIYHDEFIIFLGIER